MRNTMLLLLCTIGLSVQAQVTTLTLKDAITYALQNKAEAKKSKLQIENNEYKIQEIRSLALPQITANGSLTYNPILQTNVLDGAMFGKPGESVQVSFGQTWTSG